MWNKSKQRITPTIDMEPNEIHESALGSTRIEKLLATAKTPIEATAVVFNAILATGIAKEIDRWMRDELASGLANKFDKAMDAARVKMQEFGGDHRLFDGGHDLIGAWNAIISAKPDDTLMQEAGGYLSAIWKDVVTPMGLPVVTLNREQFDVTADIMGEALGVSRDWLMDAASFTATEGAGAVVGALAVALSWSETDIKRFSALVGSFGLSAAVSANPFLAVIAIVALARSFNAARYRKKYGSFSKGILKGGVGTGTFLGATSLVAGPAWIGLMVGVVCAVLAHKGFEKGEEVAKDVSWSDISKFTLNYIKAWTGKKSGKYGGRLLRITNGIRP